MSIEDRFLLAAESVAQLAGGDLALLAGTDPLRHIAPLVSHLEHDELVQTAAVLLQRFLAHAVTGTVMEPLFRVADAEFLPALARLDECMAQHRAFQAAHSLTPLLKRNIALAAQCCGLCWHQVEDPEALTALTKSCTEMTDALNTAVIDKVEQYRPLDAKKICWIQRAFADHQAELSQALVRLGFSTVTRDAEVAAPLAPTPKPAGPAWRNDALRIFWETKCARRTTTGSVAIDELAVLLLKACFAEPSFENREAVVRRLRQLNCAQPGAVNAFELETCSNEVDFWGGLPQWVNSTLQTGPSAINTVYNGTLNSTARSNASLSSTQNTSRSLRRTNPLLNSSTPRSTVQSEQFFSSVERNVFRATQKLIMGDASSIHAKNPTFHDTALHLAAAHDNPQGTMGSLLLQYGACPNAEDKVMSTPLHAASSAGHKELTRMLLKSGAEAGKEDRWGSTPIHKAALNGQVDIAEMLIKSGAAVDAVDGWGATPLHQAASRGQLVVSEKLLSAGANPNAENIEGERPLHIAAKAGQYALVKLLLSYGADASMKSRATGKTPGDWAKQRGHHEISTLLQYRDEWVDSKPIAMRTALVKA